MYETRLRFDAPVAPTADAANATCESTAVTSTDVRNVRLFAQGMGIRGSVLFDDSEFGDALSNRHNRYIFPNR
jgi:hypothetical protein